MLLRTNVYGWRIRQYWSAPVTGRWVAERYGVTICAGTYAELYAMTLRREEGRRK